jgi:hypothetical protein
MKELPSCITDLNSLLNIHISLHGKFFKQNSKVKEWYKEIKKRYKTWKGIMKEKRQIEKKLKLELPKNEITQKKERKLHPELLEIIMEKCEPKYQGTILFFFTIKYFHDITISDLADRINQESAHLIKNASTVLSTLGLKYSNPDDVTIEQLESSIKNFNKSKY